jgi:hypothetical protein
MRQFTPITDSTSKDEPLAVVAQLTDLPRDGDLVLHLRLAFPFGLHHALVDDIDADGLMDAFRCGRVRRAV